MDLYLFVSAPLIPSGIYDYWIALGIYAFWWKESAMRKIKGEEREREIREEEEQKEAEAESEEGSGGGRGIKNISL